jgi:RNase P/RNase MRP subunit POP5
MQKKIIQDEKLKGLIPSMRIKKRFILIKIISEEKFDFKTLSKNLNDELLKYIGLIDISKFAIWILKDKYDFEKQEFIIKVSTKGKDKILTSLALINTIDNKSAQLDVLKVSGTLKGAHIKNV